MSKPCARCSRRNNPNALTAIQREDWVRPATFTTKEADDWLNQRAYDALEGVIEELTTYFEEVGTVTRATYASSDEPEDDWNKTYTNELYDLQIQVRSLQRSIHTHEQLQYQGR